MSVHDVKVALNGFLSSDEPRAVALTGNWGRGKTFFWTSAIEEFIRNKGVDCGVQYSYVSMFGISSVSELKDAIFENTVSYTEGLEGATAETAEGSGSLGRLRSRIGQGIRKHLPLIEELPWLKKYGPFARSAAFLSIRQYIVCFDDIERRGRGLEPKEIFGLISLLTEQRQCRVIAILNSDALSDVDRKEYESFREKVFDSEIKYAPSPVECASLVFGDKDCNRLLAGEYSQRLGITNIRILQRIRRAMETLVPKVQGYESELTRQVIHSLVLLTWCYNSKESGTPPYQHVKGLGYVDFLSSKDKKEQSMEEVEWNELLKAYGYQNTDDLDSQICFYLENGFLVNEKFLGVVKNMNESVLQAKAQGAFSDIWDIYHGSFKDNEADLVKAIKDRLLAGAKWLSVREVNGAISLLRELEKNDLANELIDHWIKVTASLDMDKLNLDAAPFSDRIRDEVFRNKLTTAFVALQKQPTLDAVIHKIAGDNGWSVADVHVLSEASSKDFYHFFKSIEDRDLYKYVKACLRFGEFGDANEVHLRIAENTKDALRKIGAECELNRIRVRGFGIEAPEASDDSTL